MDKQTKIILTLIFIAIICLASFFAWQWYKSLKEMKIMSENYIENERIVNFISLFTSNMLSTEKEVSFNERLKMENAVRDIDNQEIFNQWQGFTDSSSDKEAQENARILLKLLVENLK